MFDSGERAGGGVYGMKDGVNVVRYEVSRLVLILFSTRLHIRTPIV